MRDPQAPTGVYFKDPAPGATSVYYYRAGSAASRLTEGDLDRFDPATTKVVHLSGVTPALSSTCRAMTERLFTIGGEAGVLLSFDVNHRAALWEAADAGPRCWSSPAGPTSCSSAWTRPTGFGAFEHPEDV